MYNVQFDMSCYDMKSFEFQPRSRTYHFTLGQPVECCLTLIRRRQRSSKRNFKLSSTFNKKSQDKLFEYNKIQGMAKDYYHIQKI